VNITAQTVAAVAVSGVVIYWLAKQEAKAAAQSVGEAINPVNPENIFYEGVNAAGEVLTGEEGFTLGGWIYDMTHSDQESK
jgi:hypothetical protein